jgi:hypothetical protein
MLFLPIMQAAAAGSPSGAAAPIVPVLALTIQPPAQQVASDPNSTATAQFAGTATVDKLPMVRCVVTLTSSTDIGWVSQVSPSSMVFTSESSQAFTVVVIVPAGAPTSQGKLVVDGRAVAAGLQTLAEVTALIYVKGSSALNATSQNRTSANATAAARTAAGGLSSPLTMSMIALVLVAVPVSGFAYYRRRRQRSLEPEA